MITVEPKINIIGYGFVGSSISHLCERNNLKFSVYDVITKEQMSQKLTETKDASLFKYFTSIKELVDNSEQEVVQGTFMEPVNFYFICVPTNSTIDGDCDTSIVEKVISDLSKSIKKRTVIIIKSTVKPGTSRKMHKLYGKNRLIDVVFCPEFLRELTYKDDVYTAKFTMFGLSNINNERLVANLTNLFRNYLYKHKNPTKSKFSLKKLFAKQEPKVPIELHFKKYEECEIFKYTLNTFLATKITFFNEIHELCNYLDVDYQRLKSMFKLDPRIGDYGTVVPGPGNTHYGYFLKCLPKEVRCMVKLQEQSGLSSKLMETVNERNIYFNNKPVKN
jgi:UDPglucose 6-dehydrogenase